MDTAKVISGRGRMKPKILVSILLLLLMLLTACSIEPLSNATVVDKHYEPSHTRTVMMWTGKIMIPVVRHFPEEWTIMIEGFDEDGEKVTKTYSVSKKEYKKYKIGDKYKYEEE